MLNRFSCSLFAIALVCVAFLLCTPSAKAARFKSVGSFSVDLPDPYETVVDTVRDVAGDGIVRGTFEYTGESQLNGALPADRSKLFGKPDITDGLVMYKVREHTLAPSHFKDPADVGTVAIRYMVEKLPKSGARLYIDAVYVEDSHHGNHPSDGSVETCEFTEIETKLKVIQQMKAEADERHKRTEQEARVRELQREIGEEQAKLTVLTTQVQELEKHSQELRHATLAQVKLASADLKAAPYTHAPTLQSLAKGQQVSILTRTPSWYRVRSADGQEGWIYRMFLEAAQ